MVRNDKLGDFMLSLPSFALLKTHLPDAHIAALVPEYTREMAEDCPWIDTVVIDSGPARGWRGPLRLARLLREQRFDALIALFSTGRIALAGLLAGIPYRLAPATKLAQFLYTHRLAQRRSRSRKPEFMYNLELAARFLDDHNIGTVRFPEPPFLQYPAEQVAALRAEFCGTHGIDTNQRLVFIHGGHGGSANNLTPEQFAELGARLRSHAGHVLVLSAGPGELAMTQRIGSALGATPHVIFESTAGLRRFAQHIQFADVFISGSTGPLHIAGALDRPTAAFYPRRRSATALRWQTLNTPERRLAFSPPDGAAESDMTQMDIEGAARQINERFLSD